MGLRGFATGAGNMGFGSVVTSNPIPSLANAVLELAKCAQALLNASVPMRKPVWILSPTVELWLRTVQTHKISFRSLIRWIAGYCSDFPSFHCQYSQQSDDRQRCRLQRSLSGRRRRNLHFRRPGIRILYGPERRRLDGQLRRDARWGLRRRHTCEGCGGQRIRPQACSGRCLHFRSALAFAFRSYIIGMDHVA